MKIYSIQVLDDSRVKIVFTDGSKVIAELPDAVLLINKNGQSKKVPLKATLKMIGG